MYDHDMMMIESKLFFFLQQISTMPAVSSRSIHYRALRRLRKENENLIRKMKKITASQLCQAAYHNITSAVPTVPNAPATAVDEPPIDQGELLQVIFTIITKHGLTQFCIPDLLELTKLLMGSDMEGI